MAAQIALTAPPPADLQLPSLLLRLAGICREVERALDALVAGGPARRTQEAELRAAWERRDALAPALGRAVIDWLGAGGEIELVDPAWAESDVEAGNDPPGAQEPAQPEEREPAPAAPDPSPQPDRVLEPDTGSSGHGVPRSTRPATMAQVLGALDAEWLAQQEPADLLAGLRALLATGPSKQTLQREVIALLEGERITPSDPELVRLLAPHLGALKGTRRLKTLRTHIKRLGRATRARRTEASAAVPDRPPSEWAWWPAVRGKRAALIGGEAREDARARIQACFDFAELEWGCTDVRRVGALADRIRHGNVDLLLFVRSLVSHKVQEMLQPACREAGVPFVSIDSGYGAAQVRRALERFVGR